MKFAIMVPSYFQVTGSGLMPPKTPFEVQATKKGALPVAVEKRPKGKIVTVVCAQNLSSCRNVCRLLKLMHDDSVPPIRPL